MNNNVLQLKYWLQFNDNETGILQYFFYDYVKENQMMFDNEKLFQFAVFSTNVQYYLRHLKSLIHDSEKSESIKYTKILIDVVQNFPNLCKFTTDKTIENIKSSPDFYEYLIKDTYKTSYFNLRQVVRRERVSRLTDAVQAVWQFLLVVETVDDLFESHVKCPPDILLPGALIKTAPTKVDARF